MEKDRIAEARWLELKIESEKQYEENQKRDCVASAEETALELCKNSCTKDRSCKKEGTYYMKDYESAYDVCLQRNGLK